MRKTYKIGEVANILGVSADTIRYYEKAGIVYSKKDPSNGYRYFTPADIYALLDVLFYRSMDIPVEEVRNIMNSYQHRDVKKLLEQKQEQVQAKIREQQVLLERIRATIEDYRIMEENLDVFQVRPMPSMILFHESPADNQAYFNNMIEQENQNPSQAVGSLIESGFIAARGGNRWEMTRLFTAALMPEKQTGRFPGKRPAGERAQSGLHRIAFPLGHSHGADARACVGLCCGAGPFGQGRDFRTVDFYRLQPAEADGLCGFISAGGLTQSLCFLTS